MTRKLDLGKEKIGKLFVSFAIPAILGMVAINAAGLVDSYFIGNYIGAEAIGGLTLIMPILSVAMGLAYMITSGGVVLAGISLGNEDYEKSNNYFNVTFSMTVIASIIIMIIISLSIKTITVDLMGITGGVAKHALDYAYTIIIFIVAYMIVAFFSFFLKLDSMPNLIVYVTFLGVGINIILDYVLVAKLGYGMKGAAFATGLSQVIPCIIFIIVSISKSIWKFKIPMFHVKDIKLILFNGLSEFLGLSSVGIAGYIYNIAIIKYVGVDGVSAFGIAMQIANIATMLYYGISDSIQSLVSYNYGAKLFSRVDKLRNIVFTTSLILGTTICMLLIFFSKPIASIFINETHIIELSSYIMKFYAIALIISGVNLNASTYYTALGKPIASSVISVMRSLVGLVIGLLVLPLIFGEMGLWLPLIFTELITFILVIYYIKKYPYGNKIY